jgi:hypothetical protein
MPYGSNVNKCKAIGNFDFNKKMTKYVMTN